MKKELGILLLVLITAVGFSGAIAAAPPNNNYQGPNMHNQGPNMQDHNQRHHWVVVWQGPWFKWRNSFWWKHFHSMNFWWHGKHYKATSSMRHGQRWVTLWVWR